ncbi:MAG: hypothetical protein ABIJ08_01775 [Nanoarchaeota archaeon]
MAKRLFLFCVFLLLCLNIAYAEECHDIFFFYSKTCPHCAKEEIFLAELEDNYPELNIQYYEVSENYDFFKQTCEKYGTIPVGVPRTIVNGTVFIGFTEEEGQLQYVKGYQAYNGFKNQIEKSILAHLASETNISINQTCEVEQTKKDVSNYLFFPSILILLYIIFFSLFRKKILKRYLVGILLAIIIIIFFYLSQHLPTTQIIAFAGQFSFPVFTFIIALLDGFNPCAFAVLAILLSLLVYAKSKKKMALIGMIFIITSSLMYFLFIVVLLTLRAELLAPYKNIIRVMVGLIALVAGSINIKDFFFFKQGISLTIPQEKMGKLVVRMRNIVNEVREARTNRAMFIAIIGTIILAALVNLVELGCTLILPMQYIEVLITNYGTHVTSLHYMFIAFYCLVYIIPLFFILGSFLYTFRSERMTETKGRMLKLIGGLVMFGLGMILLFRPELMVFG